MKTPSRASASPTCPACGRRTYGLTADTLFDLLAQGLPAAAVAVRAVDLRRFATRIGACDCAPAAIRVAWRSVATPPPLPADARPLPAVTPAPTLALASSEIGIPARAERRRRTPLLHRLGLRTLLGPRDAGEAPAGVPGILEWALCLEEC